MVQNLDFLIALDEHIRENNFGYVGDASGLQRVAHETGLAAPDDPWSAARWIGELVELGYIKHSKAGLGDTRPVPERWYTDSDLTASATIGSRTLAIRQSRASDCAGVRTWPMQ